jgi:hypothetical protein
VFSSGYGRMCWYDEAGLVMKVLNHKQQFCCVVTLHHVAQQTSSTGERHMMDTAIESSKLVRRQQKMLSI